MIRAEVLQKEKIKFFFFKRHFKGDVYLMLVYDNPILFKTLPKIILCLIFV